MNKLSNDLPNGITEDEVNDSCCELGDIVPDRTEDHDIVVVEQVLREFLPQAGRLSSEQIQCFCRKNPKFYHRAAAALL